MALKVTLFFEEGGEGWSEVYYTNDATIAAFTGEPPNDFKAPAPVVKLIQSRQNLLTKEVTFLRIRVSSIENPGQFLIYQLSPPDNKGLYTPADDQSQGSSEIFASLLLTLEAGVIARRKLWLGGVPEENVKSPQTYSPTTSWRRLLGSFLKIVSAPPYVCRSRPVKINNALTQIGSIDVIGFGFFIEMEPIVRPADNPTSWYVLVRGCKGPKGVNGVYRARVSSLDPTRMSLGPTRRVLYNDPPFRPVPGAVCQLFIPRYLELSGADIGRIVSRKRGRPFGQSRGRR